MKLLHIVSTPSHPSTTLEISTAFIDELKANHTDLVVEELNLFDTDIPAVNGDVIEAKFSLMSGQAVPEQNAQAWGKIEALIEEFKSADLYLVSAPMWNFSIPYALKFYIDAIVQPGYLFAYNEQGQPQGLINGKKMICITTRGGDYSEGSPFHAYDFQESYLRAIFGFVGITDMSVINVQPVNIGPEMRERAMAKGIEEAKVLANSLDIAPIFLAGEDGQSATVSA